MPRVNTCSHASAKLFPSPLFRSPPFRSSALPLFRSASSRRINSATLASHPWLCRGRPSCKPSTHFSCVCRPQQVAGVSGEVAAVAAVGASVEADVEVVVAAAAGTIPDLRPQWKVCNLEPSWTQHAFAATDMATAQPCHGYGCCMGTQLCESGCARVLTRAKCSRVRRNDQ